VCGGDRRNALAVRFPDTLPAAANRTVALFCVASSHQVALCRLAHEGVPAQITTTGDRT